MTPLVQRIAEVLRQHQPGIQDQDCDEGCCWQSYCTCGALIDVVEDDDHWGHVASLVVAALGLTQEWAATCDIWNGGRMVRESREHAEADRESELSRERHWSDGPRPDSMHLESRWVSPWVRADVESGGTQ